MASRRKVMFKDRWALGNHYSSAETFLPYRNVEGTAISQLDSRDIVIVAGKDPYAYKGIEDVTKAMVRPAGQGGCIDWATKKPMPYKDRIASNL